MKITSNLIQKFLDNRCTAEEARLVAGFFKKDPAQIIPYVGAAWNDAGEEQSPTGDGEKMWEIIHANIVRRNQVIRFRWAAAAVSLLILLTLAWLVNPGIKTPLPTVTAKGQKEFYPAWKEVANTRSKASVIKLDDSSVVTLTPGSTIRYQEPFAGRGQRAIYLVGEANFSVAHNRAKPFTVHTNLFSTTALGTSFKVSQSVGTFTVRLFEGRVLVKSVLSRLNGWKKDMVLLPGNEIKYSVKAGTLAVSRFNTPVRPLPKRVHNENTDRQEGTLVFNNTALSDVMKTLDAAYHSHIIYNEKVLAGKYFSGQTGKKDSLSVLLQVIANMNGLRIIKSKDNYVITESR